MVIILPVIIKNTHLEPNRLLCLLPLLHLHDDYSPNSELHVNPLRASMKLTHPEAHQKPGGDFDPQISLHTARCGYLILHCGRLHINHPSVFCSVCNELLCGVYICETRANDVEIHIVLIAHVLAVK